MAKLTIEGMGCMKCVAKVVSTLEGMDLENVNVNLEDGTATFDGAYNADDVKAAIDEIGYTVKGIE